MAYEYFLHIFIFFCIYAILAVSLNLVIGFVGILQLGHAAFFGIGAYTSVLLVTYLHVPWIIGLLAGGLAAGIFGVLVGIPSLKLRGDYLAVATLGFGEIAFAVFNNWTDLTGGPLGISQIPKPEFLGFSFDSLQAYAILALVFLAITVFVINRIVKSPFGRVLQAIREDQTAATAMAKNAFSFKVQALAVSAFFAGIAGSLMAHYVTFINPISFGFVDSVLILSMVILGGMASTRGALTGAFLLILFPEVLRFVGLPPAMIGGVRQLIYAILIIIIMLYRPEGIFGKQADRLPKPKETTG